jgi:hypothetical protein
MRTALFLASIFLAACEPSVDVGDGDETDAAVAGTDSGSGGGIDAPTAACEAPVTTLPNGNHNAGLACLSCHNGSGVAPRWYAAGTLFSTTQGGAAISGATITITDANNRTVKLVTAANGNFYTPMQLTMPLHVSASKCPDTKAMPPTATSGDCNSCHQAASTGRIHLP